MSDKDRTTRSRGRRSHLGPALVTLLISALATAIIYLFVPEGTTIDLPGLTSPGHVSDPGAGPRAQVKDDAGAVHTHPIEAKEPTGHVSEPAPDEDSSDEEEPEARADEPADKELAEPASTRYELAGDAAEDVMDSEAYATLTQAIASFEERGLTVAFVVHDMEGGREIAYDADEELYPASSIKGPFTTSIYQELVDKGQVDLSQVEPIARVTILESSDEGYRSLHALFGESAFISWLTDAGVGPGSYGTMEQMVAWNYPHVSARQLSLMWLHVYDYLTNSDTEASRQLASLFDRREVSSVRRALDQDVRTWSKMGWFESFSDYRSEPATVEAGTVFARSGAYVFAVMTTAPAELDALVPLLAALDGAHESYA